MLWPKASPLDLCFVFVLGLSFSRKHESRLAMLEGGHFCLLLGSTIMLGRGHKDYKHSIDNFADWGFKQRISL